MNRLKWLSSSSLFQSDSKTKITFKFNEPTLEFQFEIISSKKILFKPADEEKKHLLP